MSLRIIYSGMMIITNGSGDNESPLKIRLLMCTLPSISWFDVNNVYQFAILLSIKVIIFWATPTILAHSKIHELGTMSYVFR